MGTLMISRGNQMPKFVFRLTYAYIDLFKSNLALTPNSCSYLNCINIWTGYTPCCGLLWSGTRIFHSRLLHRHWRILLNTVVISSYESRINGDTSTTKQNMPQNIKYKWHHITKFKWFSSRLAVVRAQSIDARCKLATMKMQLEQRRQALLQLHLSEQQFYCLLRCGLH